MISALFSPDAALRFKASTSGQHANRSRTWPRGCWGAANGWLMLVGPSPGGVRSATDSWSGGPRRPIDSHAYVGRDAGKIIYSTNKGRNARWQMLAAAAFTRPDYASALTTVTNLDWGNNSDHTTIPESYLNRGCEYVFNVMAQSKPRIVITLVRKTWDVLTTYLSRHKILFPAPPKDLIQDLTVVTLPRCGFKTLVLRSPQHPSRHFFTRSHADLIKRTVAWFIRNDT
jgi:hypothetical protein